MATRSMTNELSIAEFVLQEIESINFDNQLIDETINKVAQIVASGEEIKADKFIGPHHPNKPIGY